jgi:hypothetical protein
MNLLISFTNLGLGQVDNKLMLGLGWAVSVCTDVIAHELELSGEDMTFPETQREMIRKANTKLTFHILQGCVEVFAMTEDAIDDDSSLIVTPEDVTRAFNLLLTS